MGWLKKLGSILRTVGGIAGVLPQFQQLIPQTPIIQKVESEFGQVASIVAMTESIVGSITDPAAKTGADKLRAAAPLVSQLLLTSPLLTGKKIKDQALFAKASSEIAGGFADLLNSLDGSSLVVTAVPKV